MARKWARLAKPLKHRMAMLRNMMTSLVKHERLHTTYPKAKALQRVADRMVTMAREDTPKHRCKADGFIREREMVWKLFDVIAPKYYNRPGGYTRVIKTKRRLGDYAPMAYVEFVDRQGELRPAKPVSPETTEAVKRTTERAQAVYDERHQDTEKRVNHWKSVVVPNPYSTEY